MHYIIDGYNLFFKIQNEILPLAKKRENFIQILDAIAKKVHLSITIVFDRKHFPSSFFPSKKQLKALEIIYTPENLSADAYILELLSAYSDKKNEIVVTSDKELAKEVKLLNRKTQTVEKFLSFLIKKEKRSQKTKEERKQEKESPFQIARLRAIFEKRK